MVLFGKPLEVDAAWRVAATAAETILEDFQEQDGSIAVPSVLWEFDAPRKMGSKQAGV
jgi:seryl-tRNA synthetase